jgi:uncharacterized cupredoxin-like copper-binding protein
MHQTQGEGSAGHPGRAADADRSISIDANDTGFSLDRIDVRAGETVRFVVTNTGKIDHEFSIATHAEHLEHRAMMAAMPNMKHHDADVITMKPGQTKDLIWKFGNASQLEFACDIPGHAEAGMTGTVAVSR